MADFPTFISLEFDGNTKGLDTLTRTAAQSGVRAGKEYATGFEASTAQIGDTLTKALSIPRNAGGSLDLSSTIRELQQAEKEATSYSLAAKELARAQSLVVQSSGAVSREQAQEVRLLNQISRERGNEATSIALQISAYERLQAEISKTASETSQIISATSRGTTAFSANGESLRGQRQAFVQTGQQIQDLGISLIGGQRASTVFAQQLPQLAFALTSLEGSGNKAQATIGRFAAVLSGPLGSVALVAASFGIGTLVDQLFFAEKQSDKTKKSVESIADSLSFTTSASRELAEATKELVAAQEKQLQSSYENEKQALKTAKGYVKQALAARETIQAELEAANTSAANTSGESARAAYAALSRNLSSQLQANQEAIANLRTFEALQSVPIARRRAEALRDPAKAADIEYDRQEETARKALINENRSAKTQAERLAAEKRYTDELVRQDAIRDKASKKNRNPRGASEADTRSRQQVLADFDRELEARGVRTISGYRSAQKQNRLYRQGATPADGYKIPSRHQSYRALDIDKNTFNERAVYEAGQAAGIRGLRILTESGGRKHLDFTGSGKPGTVDDRAAASQAASAEEAERRAESARRNAERLSQVSQSAADGIRQINAQFDDQPRLVDQSVNAVSRLQNILAELSEEKNQGTPRLAELKKEAEAAISVAQNAIGTDFARQTDSFNDRLRIQKLILAGREDEAAIEERLAQTEERYGVDKRIDGLQQILTTQNEILTAEDSTQAEREAAAATIKTTSSEYEKLLKFAQYIRDVTADQYSQEKALQEAIDKRNASVQRYQSVINSTYSSLENLLSGGSAKDFFKGFQEQFRQLQGQNLTEQLFGDSFRQLKKFSERNNPENVAVRDFVDRMKIAETSVDRFAQVLTKSADRIGEAANDNGAPAANATGSGPLSANGDIVVTGSVEKALRDTAGYTADQFSLAVSRSIVDPLLTNLNELLGVDYFTQLSGVLTGALSGFQRAGTVGGILGGAQGLFEKLGNSAKSFESGVKLLNISDKIGEALKGAQTGDQVALLGRSFGIKTSRTGGQLGGAAGKLIGPLLGPIGAALGPIVGGAIGSVVGGLFKKTKQGSTTVNSLSGDLAFSGSGGLREGVLGLGGGVRSGLSNIIEQLGGSAGQFAVSIGQRKKDFVVDPTGKGRTKGSGVLKFKTEEEAIRAALLDAIRDGAVKGITDGARRLLEAGKDLDAQLAKAVRFQSVFDRLKAIKDPVGAALGTLNREFEGLVSVFKEAGASATEFAQLEELYGIERARVIKETSDTLTSSLRGLIDDLKTGDSGLSLRDRLSNTRAQFNPLAEDIRAGRTVDYDKFAEISRELIDIQRQISGSQSDYFATFNEVLGLSEGALRNQSNVISIGANGATPFGPAVTPASNDNTPVVSAINSQTNSIVAGLQAVQAQIAAGGSLRQSIFGSSAAIDYQLPGGTYF